MNSKLTDLIKYDGNMQMDEFYESFKSNDNNFNIIFNKFITEETNIYNDLSYELTIEREDFQSGDLTLDDYIMLESASIDSAKKKLISTIKTSKDTFQTWLMKDKLVAVKSFIESSDFINELEALKKYLLFNQDIAKAKLEVVDIDDVEDVAIQNAHCINKVKVKFKSDTSKAGADLAKLKADIKSNNNSIDTSSLSAIDVLTNTLMYLDKKSLQKRIYETSKKYDGKVDDNDIDDVIKLERNVVAIEQLNDIFIINKLIEVIMTNVSKVKALVPSNFKEIDVTDKKDDKVKTESSELDDRLFGIS